MPRGGFSYDAEAGVKYIARVLQAREITVANFDQRQQATLSSKLPYDEVIFFFQVENLEAATPGTARATFFRNEDAPVSKWARFKRAWKELGIAMQRRPDGTTNLEGMTVEVEEKEIKVGKYGTSNTIEPSGIPSPEDIDALGKAKTIAEPLAVGPSPADLMALADGLTKAELEIQVSALGYTGWEPIFLELIAKNSLTVGSDGKLKIV